MGAEKDKKGSKSFDVFPKRFSGYMSTKLKRTASATFPIHSFISNVTDRMKACLTNNIHITVIFLLVCCSDKYLELEKSSEDAWMPVNGFSSTMTVPLETCVPLGEELVVRERSKSSLLSYQICVKSFTET